jgi:hypothetical protein
MMSIPLPYDTTMLNDRAQQQTNIPSQCSLCHFAVSHCIVIACHVCVATSTSACTTMFALSLPLLLGILLEHYAFAAAAAAAAEIPVEMCNTQLPTSVTDMPYVCNTLKMCDTKCTTACTTALAAEVDAPLTALTVVTVVLYHNSSSSSSSRLAVVPPLLMVLLVLALAL